MPYEGLGLPQTGGGFFGGLAQTLPLIAEDLQKYREKAEQDQRDLATSDMIAHWARQPRLAFDPNTGTYTKGPPLMDNETWQKYLNGSKNQKVGLTHGLMATFADDMKQEIGAARAETNALRISQGEERIYLQRQTADAEERARVAREERDKEKAARFGETVTIKGADGTDYKYLQTESGLQLMPGQEKNKIEPIVGPKGEKLGERVGGQEHYYNAAVLKQINAEHKALAQKVISDRASSFAPEDKPGQPGVRKNININGKDKPHVKMFKDGKEFWIPKDQVQDAVIEGYR